MEHRGGSMTDVVVVGGGVIGLSIAWELVRHGVSVKLLDQGAFGREASWAGAGILPPGNPDSASHPYDRLRGESCRLWPEWSAELLELTGIDNGFLNCGGIEIRLAGSSDQLDDLADAWRQEHITAERLDRNELLELEPALNPSAVVGLRLPEKCQVRNPRHTKALLAALASAGVELLPGEPVTELIHENGRIVAARTSNGEHVAGQFVVAAGAWSRRLLAACGADVTIEPVRGQIVLLETQPLPFTHIIGLGARYLVPRPDGRVLVGATEEWVGYCKQNTADAVAGLIRFAQDLVPGLAAAKFADCWSGLRPGAGDGLPYLGPVPGNDNLFVAAGHFRAGVQLSPGTAVLIRQLVLGQDLMLPLETFACDRVERTQEAIPSAH
jgi:glycine oxidase